MLLDALTDYGGTLIFVSHDRYFVDRLATKVLDIGRGEAVLYPGTYEEFRWSKTQAAAVAESGTGAVRVSGPRSSQVAGPPGPAGSRRPATDGSTRSGQGAGSGRAVRGKVTTPQPRRAPSADPARVRQQPRRSAAEHKRLQVESRRQQRKLDALRTRIADLERRIAAREEAVRKLEADMAAPGFYTDSGVRGRSRQAPPDADVGSRRSDEPVGSARARSGGTGRRVLVVRGDALPQPRGHDPHALGCVRR